MADMELMTLADPRIVDGRMMRVAGLSEEYTRERTGEIPRQWQRFNQQLLQAGLANDRTYGVVYSLAVMRYVTGVEIAPEAALPEGWIEVTVPAQRYVVFAETGGVTMIPRAWVTIFMEWLPKSGVKMTDGPMFERYPEDWVTSGDFEIWVPVG